MSPLSEVRVPDIGDFDDVPVIEILVSVGDEVAVEDPLVTLESDKATMDVPAPFAGVVSELSVAVGDRVSEGSLLLKLDGAGSADGASSDGTAGGGGGRLRAARLPRPPPPSSSDGDRDFQVVVLGSGPGGYTAAFRAADLGLRVALIERHEKLGGVCLNVGCIPSKALLHAARVIAETEEMATHGIAFGTPKVDLPKLLEWKQSVVDKLTGGLVGLAQRREVEVIHGVAKLTGASSMTVGDREITFENCIIAAGSQPATIPGLPDDERIIDSTGALSPSSIPDRLLVIGGGIIGLEMACVYDALGAKVTVVEMLDHLLTGADADLVRVLAKRIGGRYQDVLLSSKAESIKAQKNGLKVEIAGAGSRMFDRVLVAVGRVPNGRAIEAEAAGVKVDDRGFIPVDSQDAHQRAGDLRHRRHRRRAAAGPQGDARGQGGGRGHLRPRRRVRRQDDPVGGLHRPRGGVDGPDRDPGQGRRRGVREGGVPVDRVGPGAGPGPRGGHDQAALRAARPIACWARESSGSAPATSSPRRCTLWRWAPTPRTSP